MKNFKLTESQMHVGKELILNNKKFDELVKLHKEMEKIAASNFSYNIESLHKGIYYNIGGKCNEIFKSCCIRLRNETDKVLDELKGVSITNENAEDYVKAKKILENFDLLLKESCYQLPSYSDLCSCTKLGILNPYRTFEKIINDYQKMYDNEKMLLLDEIDEKITKLLYGEELNQKDDDSKNSITINSIKYIATESKCDETCAFWKNCGGMVNTCVILFGQTLNFKKDE